MNNIIILSSDPFIPIDQFFMIITAMTTMTTRDSNGVVIKQNFNMLSKCGNYIYCAFYLHSYDKQSWNNPRGDSSKVTNTEDTRSIGTGANYFNTTSFTKPLYDLEGGPHHICIEEINTSLNKYYNIDLVIEEFNDAMLKEPENEEMGNQGNQVVDQELNPKILTKIWTLAKGQ